MTAAAPIAASAIALAPSPRQLAMRRLLRHGSFWIGGGALALIILVALLGPLVLGQDPTVQDLGNRLAAPVWAPKGSWLHPLGTDHLGRDLLARLIDGARVSLFIGFATVLVSGVIGTALGMAAGYFGGRVDLVINFLITIRLTLPVVLVALVVVAVVGSSLTILILVIGLLLWDRFAVVTRSATQRLAHSDFVVAARTIGSSTPRILLVEILPNIVGPLIVVATVEIAHAVLLEAALSFLGLGVKPPLASWGLMVAEAKNQLLFRPWLIAIPGAALVTLVLAINLLGDALRDVVAPEGRA
ncbi:ABC transporter permease [Bosea sp. BK604]|uniref:ABC transporter permease n=1 Tax=Bosea sp. BK604 TaxID=2512180 RepID=UPI001042ECCE|nr:ABC transporter permease [Bosea sp. BK604]TCR65303.1 peptide/nickel transport system permease protein [Bosea sp. BK604]